MTISLQENLDKINSLISYIRSTDTKIKFRLSSYNAIAGGSAIVVNIDVVNANDVLDTFSNVSQVNVNVTGSAILTQTNPITITNGTGLINISNTIAETVTLSLVDSGSTGLDVSNTAAVIFA